RILCRHFRIDAMQLIQVDPAHLQTLQAFIHALLQIFRTTIRRPLTWARSSEATLRRDDQPLRIRMERFGNEQFARFRSIGISGVDQVYPELNGPAQDLERIRAIGGPTPNSFTGDPHGSETEAIHRKIAAQFPNGIARPPSRCRWGIT